MRWHHILPQSAQTRLKQAYDGHCERRRLRLATAHLANAAATVSDGCLDGLRTLADWQARRSEVRRQLQWMLGLDPLPERTPVLAEITGIVTRPSYRIEKLVFQSLPGLYVTANFYLPVGPPTPRPCVVYLNGHWPSLDGAKTGFQDRYLWYPANGFALLAIDPMGFGEIPGIHAGMQRLNRWHWLSLGYTPAGVEVWNAMRALDWLCTRPEIDATRIGVTGISGGGVMSQYLAALDDRVVAVAASCSTYTIGDQVAGRHIPDQCDCTFYPNVCGMDFPEVLALIAPRPLLIMGGRRDPVFPPSGFREAFRKVKGIYRLYRGTDNTASRIRLVESGEGHTDAPHFLRETHCWMNRWLRDQTGTGSERVASEPVPPVQLRSLTAIPRVATNYHVEDVWIARPALRAPAGPEEWSRRREHLLRMLCTRVFAWWPKTGAPFRTRRLVASGGFVGSLARFGAYEFDAEAGVPVRVCLLTPQCGNGPWPLIVWVRQSSEHVAFPDVDEFHPFLRTHAVALLTPRFADRPFSGAAYAAIERSAALTGRSLATMGVWDIRRTLAWVARDRGVAISRIILCGRGYAGIQALYAAVFEPVVTHVVLREAPLSHRDGPAVPTVMRDTDIEEVAALLAPRRLTLLVPRGEEWTVAKAVYELVGAGEAFGTAPSLAEALLAAGEPGGLAGNFTETASC